VIAESPDRKANERFVDDLASRLRALVEEQKRGGPQLVSYVEDGTKDVHDFYENNKWLYAEKKDLDDAYDTIDFQIAVRSGLVADLGDDDDHPAPAKGGAASRAGSTTANGAAVPAADSSGKKPALGLDEYQDRWEAKAKEKNDFPSGYFETPDGTMIGLRIVSLT
jgi:hypothetical protein